VAGTWGGSSLLSSQPLLAAAFLFWTDPFAPECPRLPNFVDLLLARLATLDRRGQQGYFRFQRRSLQIFLLEPRLLILASIIVCLLSLDFCAFKAFSAPFRVPFVAPSPSSHFVLRKTHLLLPFTSSTRHSFQLSFSFLFCLFSIPNRPRH
jgi:hypothetical protein